MGYCVSLSEVSSAHIPAYLFSILLFFLFFLFFQIDDLMTERKICGNGTEDGQYNGDNRGSYIVVCSWKNEAVFGSPGCFLASLVCIPIIR